MDTGPVLERAWTERAGLGWIGKNSMLLTRGMGSWLMLGEILSVSAAIAAAVIRLARDEGLATAPIPEDVDEWVKSRMWKPVYPNYV